MSDKKEVEEVTDIIMYYCPYCETRYEDDKRQAMLCRDRCYKKELEEKINTIKTEDKSASQ